MESDADIQAVHSLNEAYQQLTTLAALLEAMQEQQVTVGGQRHVLPDPFFVLATQNPIEQEGTYPLPEAQLDRFVFHVWVDYPNEEDELEIVKRTTADLEVKI